MKIEELPTSIHMLKEDWEEVFNYNAVATDADRYPEVPDATVASPTLDHIKSVISWNAVSNATATEDNKPSWGGTELQLSALFELLDGRHALVEAWNDYTGWGCQDGVEWAIGSPDRIALRITDEQAAFLGGVVS